MNNTAIICEEKKTIKLGILDDHPLIINGLKQMLQTATDLTILFSLQDPGMLFNHLETFQPDVLLLDIELPNENGIDLCARIKAEFPELGVIALTNHNEIVFVRKMIKNGAKGYLLKGTDRASLTKAIETVFEGGQYIDSEIEQHILQHAIEGRNAAVNVKLTHREIEVLTLIANELSNQEIAEKLFLSIRTVESHRHSLNHKLNIKTTAGLVKEAYLRGLI